MAKHKSKSRSKNPQISLVRVSIRSRRWHCQSSFVGSGIGHNLVDVVVVVVECDGRQIVELDFHGGSVHKVASIISEMPDLECGDGVASHHSEGINGARCFSCWCSNIVWNPSQW